MPILLEGVLALSVVCSISYLFYKILSSEKDKDLKRKEAEIQRKDDEIARLKKEIEFYKS